MFGLVNGTEGTAINFLQDSNGKMKKTDIQFNDENHKKESVANKFEIQ